MEWRKFDLGQEMKHFCEKVNIFLTIKTRNDSLQLRNAQNDFYDLVDKLANEVYFEKKKFKAEIRLKQKKKHWFRRKYETVKKGKF